MDGVVNRAPGEIKGARGPMSGRWLLARGVVFSLVLAATCVPAPAAGKPGDWPHWRGPSGDGKSPLQGIRKEWTGGLRKVFEITDLCPARPDGKEDPADFSASAPVVGGGILVALGRREASDRVCAFDAAGGRPLWKKEYDAKIDDLSGFVTSGYNTGCQAFDVHGKQVTPLWGKNKVIASCSSDPVIVDGFVYSFSGQGTSGKLKCLDLKTGKEKWTAADLGNGSLLWVDGCLCCLSYSGKLALVEARPDAYHELAEMKIFEAEKTAAYTCPIIAADNVYLRFGPRLACYRLTEN
jgi:outer membrane protein assembly factor BamB